MVHVLPGDLFGWDTSMENRITVVDTNGDATDYRRASTAISLAKWKVYPPLRSFFPLKFSGKARWDTMSFGCGDCKAAGRPKQMYAGDEVRGHVGRLDMKGIHYIFEAALHCPECHKMTFFRGLLPETQEIVMVEQHDGQLWWVTYDSRRPEARLSWWQRFRAWVRRGLHGKERA